MVSLLVLLMMTSFMMTSFFLSESKRKKT